MNLSLFFWQKAVATLHTCVIIHVSTVMLDVFDLLITVSSEVGRLDVLGKVIHLTFQSNQ